MAGRSWLFTSFALSLLVVQLKAQDCVWIAYNNTLIYGGTSNPASSPEACQAACLVAQSSVGCRSIDWAPTNSPDTRCFLLQTRTGTVNATGVTHYDFFCPASPSTSTSGPSSSGLSTSTTRSSTAGPPPPTTSSSTAGPPPPTTSSSTRLSTTFPFSTISTSSTPGPPTTSSAKPPLTSGTRRDCSTTYEIFPDTSSVGADPVPEIRDAITCTKTCTAVFACVGFDFSQSTGCWIHTNASAFAQKFYQSGVTQYKVNRCPEEGIAQCIEIPTVDVCDKSCFPTWARYENTAGSGGQPFNISFTNDYNGCLWECFDQPACIGIEWTAVPGSDATCAYYNTSQQSAMTASTSLKPFVTQYRLLSRCGRSCQSYWQFYNNSRFRTLNATIRTDVTSEAGCLQACRLSATCQSALVTRTGPFVCTLADEFYDGSNSSAPNFANYVYRFTCNDTLLPSTPIPLMSTTTSTVPDPCIWIVFNKTNIFGGMSVGASNLSACQSSCRNTTTCQGIDWVPDNSAGQQCYLLSTQNGKNAANWNVTHYDLSCNSTTGSSSSTSATRSAVTSQTTWPVTIVTTAIPITDPCVWIVFNKTNIFGGVSVGASNLSACQSSCRNTTTCQGIDWVPDNAAGQQCYLLSTQNGKNAANWNVTHYDLTCNSTTGSNLPTSATRSAFTSQTIRPVTTAIPITDPCIWIVFNKTNIFGGMSVGASNLSACQSSCRNTTTCQGIDWVPDNSAGQQCYLLTTQNGKNAANWNVTHYDLSCNSTTGTSTIGTTTGTSAGTSPSTSISTSARTSTGGTSTGTTTRAPLSTTQGACTFVLNNNTNIFGGTGTAALTLDDCKVTCLANASCLSIDWSLTNAPGQRCFILPTQTGKNFASNVEHYDRTCKGGCTWSPLPNTNVFGGSLYPVNDVNACQAICLAINGCVGLDFVEGAALGQRCFTFTRQGTKFPANGVTHYDLNC